MRRLVVLGATAGLLMTALSLASAATNLNSSRSNIYRLTYPTDLVSQEQVKALLEALDKLGPADQETLKKWLPANFRTHGIAPDRVKKIVILPPDKERKEIAVILLTNPADEAAAIAVTVTSSKSNSSD
jgi:hypothetical protein